MTDDDQLVHGWGWGRGLPSVTDAFECEDGCPSCNGDGMVCEDHPAKPFGFCCGAAGMPCRPENRAPAT